jgi:hypothetical protein
MDYKTARSFLIDQGNALENQRNPDAFLTRLKQGQAPIPGQVTSILLALKMVYDGLKDAPMIDKQLTLSLHLLSLESIRYFEVGANKGIIWPPLLKEDVERIANSVKNIFSGTWQ